MPTLQGRGRALAAGDEFREAPAVYAEPSGYFTTTKEGDGRGLRGDVGHGAREVRT